MRVLVVDADGRESFAISHMLEASRITVDRAGSASQSLSLVKRHHYDVLIVDFDRSSDVICKIRDACPDCPIVAILQSHALYDLELARDLGADCYLPKPFGRRELLDCVLGSENRCIVDELPVDAAQTLLVSSGAGPTHTEPMYCKVVER